MTLRARSAAALTLLPASLLRRAARPLEGLDAPRQLSGRLNVRSCRVTVAATLGLVAALLPYSPAEAAGSTTLVSVVNGAPVEYGSLPAISADGSTVVFSATVDGVNGLYARNRSTRTTQQVNVTADGTPASWMRGLVGWDVSSDGRYVVFATDAPEFATSVEEGCAERDDSRDEPRYYSVPCPQVYLRDLVSGTTTLVSVGTDGAPLVLGGREPAISADGETVAFMSGGGQTTSGGYSTARALVRDRILERTEEVSVNSDEVPADGSYLGDVDLSADGNTVVFGSNAGNLGPKAAQSGGSDIYVRNRAAGTTTPAIPSTTAVLQQGESFQTAVSGDGGLVAFMTQAKLSAEDSNPSWDVYFVAHGGAPTLVAPGASFTDRPQFSDDGRFLLFRGVGGTLSDGVVHIADVASGALTTVPRDASDSPVHGDTGFHSISGDGRFVAWTTRDQNVVNADLSGVSDQVFVTDMTPTPDYASGTGLASTGTAPSLTDVIETTVSGSPGAVTIQELADATPPVGWSVLGQQVDIAAEPVTSGFLTFTFSIHSSITPFGLAPADVAVLRNGEPLPACSSSEDAGPCVAQRSALPSGDWQFVARSPHASVWAVAVSARPADTTAPTITIDRPADGARYLLGQSVATAYSCDDGSAGSGVTGCVGPVPNGAMLDTASIGPKQFTVTSADRAGNSATRTASYAVVWPLTAFLTPVANAPVVNTMKAGGIVPVRFSLGGDRGMSVLAGSPQVQQVMCPAGTTREIGDLLKAGAAPLSVDAKARYTYAWATNKTWAGSCRQLTVTFADGQQRTAVFKLRK